jgi:hypothetical protein
MADAWTAAAAAEPADDPTGTAQPNEGLTRTERGRLNAYRTRFVAILVGLALVAGAGFGAFIIALAHPSAPDAPKWSGFEPTGSTLTVTRQIASQVSRSYRLAGGRQLVTAFSGPATVSAQGAEGGSSEVPIKVIAIRPDTTAGKAEETDVTLIDAANSYQFTLCGLGQGCSVPDRDATSEREALLRREALELALYALRYVDSLKSVYIFLPPRPTTGQNLAAANVLFLSRSDLSVELHRPLAQTLDPGSRTAGAMSAAESDAVNRITLPRLYTYEYQQAPDLSPVLILSPVTT